MTKYLIPALLIIAAIAFFAVQTCRREPIGKTEQLPEQARKQVINPDSIFHAGFLASEAKSGPRIKALERELKTATAQDKERTEKARQSADTYAKNKTLANCDTALTDCQQENETKAAVIAVQGKIIAAKDSTGSRRLAEVIRQRGVIDTLNTGWKEANAENAVLQDQIRKEKRKRFGIGPNVSATYVDKVRPVVGIGIQYNVIRF